MTIPLVVGLGSSHGDDQAGWLVIDCLRELGYPVNSARKAAHPADLLDDLQASLPLTVCDAVQESGTAGEVRYWTWPTDELLSRRSSGSHDLSLPQILELTRALEGCPTWIEIWGITGQRWSPTDHPSQSVRNSAREVAASIWSRCHA